MSKKQIIRDIEAEHLKQDLPSFKVGDTLRIHTRIIEGEKERTQIFTGTVIGRSGTGLSETVSLYRVAFGNGMERKFLLHSPRIAKVERTVEGHVRRAKLYYLRGTTGKKARVKQKVRAKVVNTVAPAAAAPAAQGTPS